MRRRSDIFVDESGVWRKTNIRPPSAHSLQPTVRGEAPSDQLCGTNRQNVFFRGKSSDQRERVIHPVRQQCFGWRSYRPVVVSFRSNRRRLASDEKMFPLPGRARRGTPQANGPA
jgi:hypothetical protein